MVDRTDNWEGLVAAWEKSGLSQSEFCRRRGVKLVTFGWWKRKLKGVTSRRRSGGKVSSRSRTRRANRRAQFVEVALPRSVAGATPLPERDVGNYEIAVGNGCTIRLPRDFDVNQVTRLISAVTSTPMAHQPSSVESAC